jgi:thioredoxin-like negative regulator of GroEL
MQVMGLKVKAKEEPPLGSKGGRAAPQPRRRQWAAGGIRVIGDEEAFSQLMKEAGSAMVPVVIHFTAASPCCKGQGAQALEARFQSLALRYDGAFATLAVDKVGSVADGYKLMAIPSWVVVEGGKEVARLEGPTPEELGAFVARHIPAVVNAPST